MDDYLEEIVALRDEQMDFLEFVDNSDITDDSHWLDEDVATDDELVLIFSEHYEPSPYTVQ